MALAFGMLELHWEEHVNMDPRNFRATEVHRLQGDPTLSRQRLGGEHRVAFQDLVRMMVDHDLELRQERTLRDAGHTVAARGGAAV